jgi:hypothetical protein
MQPTKMSGGGATLQKLFFSNAEGKIRLFGGLNGRGFTTTARPIGLGEMTPGATNA